MKTFDRTLFYNSYDGKDESVGSIEKKEEYHIETAIADTSTGEKKKYYDTVVPFELNLFSDIPKEAYLNNHFKQFEKDFTNIIIQTKLERLALPKFHLVEFTEKTVDLEWVFNYFRSFFFFNTEGKDYYGVVKKNPSTGELSNVSRPFDPSENYAVIKSSINDIFLMQGLE